MPKGMGYPRPAGKDGKSGDSQFFKKLTRKEGGAHEEGVGKKLNIHRKQTS